MNELVGNALNALLFFSIFIALILNLAVLRDKYIESSSPLHAAVRRLQLAGLLLLLFRFAWLYYSVGVIDINPIAAIGITMLSMSSGLQCALMIEFRWNNQYRGIERRSGDERRSPPVEPVQKDPRRKGERRADTPCVDQEGVNDG